MLKIELRAIILFQIIILTTSINAEEIYKYTDQNGKIYFSDKPLQDRSLKLNWKHDETPVNETNPLLKTSGHIDKYDRTQKAETRAQNLQYDLIIQSIAAEENIHPHLLHAVVRAESGYRPQAISTSGARGLMQLMPSTAKRFQVSDLFNPKENLRGGARYLRYLLDLFDNDLHLALAAYNSGEYTPAIKSGQIPANAETKRFVKKVQSYIMDEQSRHIKTPSNPAPTEKTTSVAIRSSSDHISLLTP